MASIDLSRHITDPAKHYAGVRMKQGQVLTDDDFNEAARITEAETRRTRLDVIGPTGTPDAGFLPGPGPKPDDMSIAAGALYLGGLRLTVDPPGETYRTQRDWLRQSKADFIVPPVGSRTDLAWVEAWEQPVVAAEDAELLERALGGPDASGRTRTMRRIHIATDVGTQDCVAAWSALKTAWAAEGSLTSEMEFSTDARLRVTFGPPGDSGDLCSPTIQGGYLGALNQAIRVQLTDSSHFVWGFDNAAPLYRVQVQTDKNGKRRVLKMVTRPRDQAHWPLAGQVIELLPWSAVLPNRSKKDGSLDHRVAADGSIAYNEKLAETSGLLALLDGSYNPADGTLTVRLADEIASDYGQEWTSRPDAAEIGDAAHPWLFMRVWNHGAVPAAGEKTTQFQVGKEAPLGATGLSVTITGSQLRAGDYWIIAARPATPDQVTPWQLDADAGRPPHGPKRYRAPLGLLEWGPGGGKLVHDCRKSFLPLTLIRGCCTITVGDGHTSFGQVNDIQTALNMLPDDGGEICLLPGRHRANARLRGLGGVTIHGCHERTWVIADDPKQPVFQIEDGGRRIVIEKLAVQAGEGASGILAAEDARAANLTFSELVILAGPHPGIEAHDVAGLTIRSCHVAMRNVSGPWPAIFSSAQDALIERNLLELDRTAVAKSFVAASNTAGRGGLQLGGGSNRVRVRDNHIRSGVGNGVTLGSLRQLTSDGKPKGEILFWVIDADDPCSPCKPGGVVIPIAEGDNPVRYRSAGDLYDILIDGNRIEGQGLSGVGVVGFFNPAQTRDLIVVNGLTLRENRIALCLNRAMAPIPAAMRGLMGYGAVTLGGALNLNIAGNTIIDNGADHLDPVCGIFVLIASAAEIHGNHIENTGAKTEEPSTAARPGARSGIHVGFAMPDLTVPKAHTAKPVAKFGLLRSGAAPALTVTDNIVGQPLGRSLTVAALGPVAARGNRLVSQGVGVDFISALAGNVLILTLGFTHEFPLLWLALMLQKSFGAMSGKKPSSGGPSAKLCEAVQKNPGQDVIQLGAAIPSAKTMFTDNQCFLDLTPEPSAVLFTGCLLISTDDIVFSDNQAEISESQQYTMVNTVLAGMSVRAAGNRFAEGWLDNKKLDPFGERLSALTVGVMNATTDNQGTHCFQVTAAYPNLAVDRGNRALMDAFCPKYCAEPETPLRD